MTKAKSSSPYNPDKNRVTEIKRLKAKVGPQAGRSVATIQNGKPKAISIYSLPRKFLRLNPANHRFRSSLNSLKKTRVVAKKKGQDIKNPFDFDMVKKNIEKRLEPKFKNRFKVILVPNITNISYGRGVGYKIEEVVLPDEIQKISATKIRAKMRKEGKLK